MDRRAGSEAVSIPPVDAGERLLRGIRRRFLSIDTATGEIYVDLQAYMLRKDDDGQLSVMRHDVLLGDGQIPSEFMLSRGFYATGSALAADVARTPLSVIADQRDRVHAFVVGLPFTSDRSSPMYADMEAWATRLHATFAERVLCVLRDEFVAWLHGQSRYHDSAATPAQVAF